MIPVPFPAKPIIRETASRWWSRGYCRGGQRWCPSGSPRGSDHGFIIGSFRLDRWGFSRGQSFDIHTFLRNTYYFNKVPHATTLFRSFWWKDICKLMDKSRACSVIQVSKGDYVLLWSNHWQRDNSYNPPEKDSPGYSPLQKTIWCPCVMLDQLMIWQAISSATNSSSLPGIELAPESDS